jgi:hypothetical protein
VTTASSLASYAAEQTNGKRLFKRNAQLLVYAQSTNLVGSNTAFFSQGQNGVLIESPLRILFEVKKTLAKTPNSCTVTMRNLAPSTRAALQDKPLYAVLSAGYDGVNQQLFAGNIMHAVSTLKAPLWETKIQLGDGGRAYAYAYHSKSYKPGVTVYQVLSDAAQTMGLPLPSEIKQTPELRQPLPSGLSLNGFTRDTLTTVLAPYGYNWSVQDGRLVVLRDGQLRSSEAYVIDQSAGMIESPELSVPKKVGDPVELTVKTLLYPGLSVGSLIQLKSDTINGQFRIKELEAKGDTRAVGSSSYYTQTKATPISISTSVASRMSR